MPRAVADVRREHVESFIEDQLTRLKPANRYRSLQQFFKWLADDGEIEASPMARVKPPTIPEAPPDVLRPEMRKATVQVCGSSRTVRCHASPSMRSARTV